MFDATLLLLAKDHQRELQSSFVGTSRGRERSPISEETRLRRVAAARKLLNSAIGR
ncbi:MAG TPA: hypothetical protein VI138_07680 [Candidatus Dormibacteraeota bacterium]